MSRSRPRVSIVIPFYNCAFVAFAIESALGQTYPDVEVVVVNDGSTREAGRIAPYLHRIVYVEKPNGGTSTALNAGIARSSGSYWCWLSSDDVHLPTKVAEQLAFMQARSAEASHTAFADIDGTGTRLKDVVRKDVPDHLALLTLLQHHNPINGSSVMMTRRLFDRIGPFAADRPLTQDYDYWLRVALEHEIPYLDRILLQYRRHDAMSTLRFSSELVAEAEEVRLQYLPAVQRRLRWEQLKQRLARWLPWRTTASRPL